MKTTLKVSKDLHEVLITELHHRFYNSLQVISSLAGGLLRADLSALDQRRQAAELQERVVVIGQLYRLLSDKNETDFERSCEQLCEAVALVFAREDVRFRLAVDSGSIDAPSAEGLLLILTELVTNAIKHSVADAPILIEVDLAIKREGGYELTVKSPGDPRCGDDLRLPRVASQLARGLGGILTVDAKPKHVVHVQVPNSLS
ncbi:histidine kinase dimerization/phosphoacceptor domain -containing protein [Sphingomonas sp. RB3P16]|uniref:histidine kinase dimerization/phosphoacceptor domain -containing protein n=1 Tax=Parasphingomonas frigoris TaxID=3096163 RepID=UPI002FC91325